LLPPPYEDPRDIKQQHTRDCKNGPIFFCSVKGTIGNRPFSSSLPPGGVGTGDQVRSKDWGRESWAGLGGRTLTRTVRKPFPPVRGPPAAPIKKQHCLAIHGTVPVPWGMGSRWGGGANRPLAAQSRNNVAGSSRTTQKTQPPPKRILPPDSFCSGRIGILAPSPAWPPLVPPMGSSSSDYFPWKGRGRSAAEAPPRVPVEPHRCTKKGAAPSRPPACPTPRGRPFPLQPPRHLAPGKETPPKPRRMWQWASAASEEKKKKNPHKRLVCPVNRPRSPRPLRKRNPNGLDPPEFS